MGPDDVAQVTAQVVERLRAAGCVFAEDEAALLIAQAADTGELDRLVSRRVDGEPLEHVLGWVEFCGRRLAVAPGVFVPRHRTELLVAQAVTLGRGRGDPVVLDLCCGSGALGVVVAATLPGARLHACDVDPVAVACARRNVEPLGGTVYEGDLFAPLPADLRGRVDVLLANVPYVPTGEVALMPREARDHEPRTTLDGGPDGLAVLRRVTAEVASWLAPGGHLLSELGEPQVDAALEAFRAGGLDARIVEDDDALVAIGTLRPLPGP